jgi:iron(III) transport system ATP-binding protein
VNELQGKVHNGMVSTAVGNVPAQGLAEGSDAQVMIRPEALRIVERDLPAEEHRHSHVVMAKLLGRTSLLHLCAHGENGLEAHLHARVPGVFLPAEGQPVDIHLDLSQVFVFPLSIQAFVRT